ncbi:hypothetical protein ACN2MM_10910 [Alkalilimnicola ehrlichii MLHE-1]|uniref:Uncharacterized protein n=1 Tax=Alkalilimnicola ehrlichii (strain ATCC BAA-1101 / DSM 17681 / MLHE-1) TaxID=187272 RepID=Q0A713_ALKEH|nr:hypothetical protein [Alkalilimnicola ehrlichii]ABI57374.1 hypothetical protein Mlg_2032 [Alkalilimnicola ehrlichii MLHE-1]
MIRAGLLLLLALWLPVPAAAHALLNEPGPEGAITVLFHFPGSERPWFEHYDVHGPGDDHPFQTGRVNALGEVSFRPDRPGEWQVQVTTEDGHASTAHIQVDPEGVVTHQAGTGSGPINRIVVALGYLLGLFGLLNLWQQQKHRRSGGGHAHS